MASDSQPDDMGEDGPTQTRRSDKTGAVRLWQAILDSKN